jgi:hypothetical protein
MYGVWIPGRGWVRGEENRAFADYNKEVAEELAKRLGNYARVYFIDSALVDLENKLLEAERTNKHMTWFWDMLSVFKNREIDKQGE